MNDVKETLPDTAAEIPSKPSPSAISSMQGLMPQDEAINKDAQCSVSMPQKFESREDVDEYYRTSLENFGNSETNQRFLDYIESKGISLEDLTEKQANGNFSKYLTHVHGLAQEAGISSSSSGTLVHRLAELHTLRRYPDEVASGGRLLEQTITYQGEDGTEHRKELDRVTVRNGTHHIQDIKPIHLGEFAQTEEGQAWTSQMTNLHGEDFREKIKRGEISPLDGLPVHDSSRTALVSFSKKDVGKYKIQLDKYRQLYQQANPNVKTAKPSVLPYYVW
jgi:hypothetical protein